MLATAQMRRAVCQRQLSLLLLHHVLNDLIACGFASPVSPSTKIHVRVCFNQTGSARRSHARPLAERQGCMLGRHSYMYLSASRVLLQSSPAAALEAGQWHSSSLPSRKKEKYVDIERRYVF